MIAWTTSYITMTVFDRPAQGVAGNIVVRNLAEVGSSFAALMQDMASPVQMPWSRYGAWMDGSAIGEVNLALMHTEFMRGGNAHETMQNSIALGYSEVQTAMTSITITQTYVFIGMASAIVFVGLVVFLPILYHIDRSSDTVMLQFVNLPPIVRRSLYDQAFRRAKVLRRDFSEDDDDEQVDDDEDDDENAALAEEVARAADGGETVVGGGAPSDDLSVDWAALAAQTSASALATQSSATPSRWGAVRAGVTAGTSRGSPSGKRSSRKKLPAYKKSRLSFFVFVARFLGPLVVLLVFFSTIFGRFMEVINTLETLTAVTTAADNRASCSRQAMVDLR
jgi:UPF0716 family protein affecting phage T7 exclusion